MLHRKLIATSVAFLIPGVVQAHITLDVREAPADGYYKATLRVPHGCDGSPTRRIRVQLPEGVTSVKIQPKPGWKVSSQNRRAAEGEVKQVGEVTWAGGPLPDSQFDEFGIYMKLPDKPGETLYFPVLQECVKGSVRWNEIPDPQKPGLKEPAPALRLLPRR